METYYNRYRLKYHKTISVLQVYLATVNAEVYNTDNHLHLSTTLHCAVFREDIEHYNGIAYDLAIDLFDIFRVNNNIPISVIIDKIGNKETNKILKLVEAFILLTVLRYSK